MGTEAFIASRRDIEGLRKAMLAMELRLTIRLGALIAAGGCAIIMALRIPH